MFTARDFGPPGRSLGGNGTGRREKVTIEEGSGLPGSVGGDEEGTPKGLWQTGGGRENGKKWEPCFSDATKR